MRSSNRHIIYNIDPLLTVVYLILVFFGLATIYSSSYNEEFPNLFSMDKEYGKQVIWIVVALFLGLAVFNLDKDFFT